MAFRVPGHQGAAGRVVTLPRWPRYVIPAVLVLVAALVLISIIAGIWTDYMWYRSVGQTRVFGTTYGTRLLMFLIGAVFMVAAVGVNIYLAYRMRPAEPPEGPEQQAVQAYRQAIDSHRRIVLGIVLGLIALISGFTAAGSWQTWLMFVNRVPFGIKDPQFHLDISFFVFVYPFLRLLLSFLFAAILLSLVMVTAVHVLYGGIRPARHAQPTSGARAQLFLLGGVFMALKAAAYWVDRYGISFSQRGIVQTGASYTDVNAVLPAKTVLAVIAAICAGLFLAGVIRRSSLLPAIGFGLLVLSAVLIGGLYPLIIQQFVVKPNQQVKERPYIAREIAGTRFAYGVANAGVTPYPAITTASAATLAAQAAALPDVRLLDPGVVSEAFQQLQQVKSYYQFPNVLALDRYKVGSNQVPQDMVVSVRGMSGPPAGQANWISTHLIYTHGYGVVAAGAAQPQANGNPQFTVSDIPPSGVLGSFQPRVYFGPGGTDYVIVGTHQPELDYPNGSTGGQQNTSYAGGGGVPIGSFFTKLAYAVKFRDLNIMLSSAIDSQSKVLYIRDPLARVSKVAPFLTLDGDPYPVIVKGQVLWVVDGYTTTDNYPYSQRLSLSQATSNTYSPGGLSVGGGSDQINYIRNSVKATVNAYTGAVRLYQWGKADPVLRDWMNAFPGLISPARDIPKLLLPHLRYPEVLFDAQRQILAQYHVLQPDAFYGGQNFWSVPNDPTVAKRFATSQPPYYLTLSMPGASPEFSLTTLLAQRARDNLAAFIAVNSNPLSKQYGRIQILQLPQDTAIFGPQQIQSNMEGDTFASSQLSLYRTGGSQVILGNLVTVPLDGALLSVEPVYLKASNAGNTGAYPQLKRVFTYFNGQVGFEPTLAESLAQVFGAAVTSPTGPPATSPTGQVSAAVMRDITQAEHFYQLAQAALRSGNFAQYGQDIAQMKSFLDQAQKAAHKSGSSLVTPTPTGSRSPSPGSSPSVSPSP